MTSGLALRLRLPSAATASLRVSRIRTAPLPSIFASESSLRVYSSSSPSAFSDAGAEERPFAYPRVEDLFHRMKTLERDDLTTIRELVHERIGIEITPEMFMGGGADVDSSAGDGASAEEEKVEEKTAFDLKLTAFDAKAKIKVIKEVRAMAGLGLKEAKDLVEGAPKVVKKGIKKEEAEELKAKLEAVGATVEIA